MAVSKNPIRWDQLLIQNFLRSSAVIFSFALELQWTKSCTFLLAIVKFWAEICFTISLFRSYALMVCLTLLFPFTSSSMVRWTVLQMTIDIFQLLEPKLLGLFIFDAAPVSTWHGCGCGIRIRSSQTDFGYLDHNLLGMSGQIQEIM